MQRVRPIRLIHLLLLTETIVSAFTAAVFLRRQQIRDILLTSLTIFRHIIRLTTQLIHGQHIRQHLTLQHLLTMMLHLISDRQRLTPLMRCSLSIRRDSSRQAETLRQPRHMSSSAMFRLLKQQAARFLQVYMAKRSMMLNITLQSLRTALLK